MRKQYLIKSVLLISLTVSSIFLKANVDTVIVGPNNSMSFSPNSFNINLGDSILWIWESGSHTTTSTSIPASAASWDQPMNSPSTSFLYVPTVAGKYNYQCTPHSSIMQASFTVLTSTGLAEQGINHELKLSHNVGNGSFLVSTEHTENARLRVFGANGQLMVDRNISIDKERVDISGVADGIYFIYLYTTNGQYLARYLKY